MEPKAKDKKLIIMMTWIQILQKCKKEGLEPSWRHLVLNNNQYKYLRKYKKTPIKI